MPALVVIAAVVVLVLLMRTAAARPPGQTDAPPPVVSPSTPGSGNTGAPTTAESLADAAQATARASISAGNKRSQAVIKTIGAGWKAGCAIGGPLYGMLGAVLAGWAAAFLDAMKGPPTVAPPFPAVLCGLPYRPDLAVWTPDGATLVVPSPQAPIDPCELAYGTDLLAEILPGNGALAACRRAGMIAWRPFDISTPFSRDLAARLPHLDVHARELGVFFWNFTAAGVIVQLDNLTTGQGAGVTDAEIALLILSVRKAAMLRETGSTSEATITAGMVPNLTKLAPDAVVLRGQDLGTCLAWYLYREYATRDPDDYIKLRVTLYALARVVDAPVWMGAPRIADEYVAENQGGDWTLHRARAGLGFPGAWCLASPDEPLTLGAGAPSIAAPVARVSLSAGSGVTVAAPARAPIVRIVQASAAPDLENEFRFHVWTSRGEETVSSSSFAPPLGSHTAVLAALESGVLAWDPRRNAPEVWARWTTLSPAIAAEEMAIRAGQIGDF